MTYRDPYMSALEAAYGPSLARVMEEAKSSSLSRAMEEAQRSHALASVQRALGVENVALAQEELRKRLAPFEGISEAVRAVEERMRSALGPFAGLQERFGSVLPTSAVAQAEWQGLSERMGAITSGLDFSGVAAELRALAPFAEFRRRDEEVEASIRSALGLGWKLPNADELRLLGASAAATAAIGAGAADIAGLGRSLASQMAAVHAPWALEQAPHFSAAAFGRISTRVAALLEAEPFTEGSQAATTALFGRPLGREDIEEADHAPERRDDARADAGADAALFVIPAEARVPVGRAVGLVIPAPEVPMVRPLSADDDFAFSSEAEDWLRAAELTLRFFVVRALHAAHGDGWVAVLPPGMAERWETNRAKQLSAGRPEYALYHYADLGDWSQVIYRHWKLIFAPAFGKKSYLETAFDHLIPLRNEDGHHRPMGSSDQLVAVGMARLLVSRMEAYRAAQGWAALGD